jgi:hypothetical protein
MDFEQVRKIFYSSLALTAASIVTFFVAGALMPAQSDPNAADSFMMKVAYVPPTNIWTAVTHIACYVGIAALLVAIVSGTKAYRKLKAAA